MMKPAIGVAIAFLITVAATSAMVGFDEEVKAVAGLCMMTGVGLLLMLGFSLLPKP